MNAFVERLVHDLAERGLTVAVAEADTGGLIGSLITDVPGCSRVFPGGVIAYGNRPKRELLGVPADLLVAHGAVSAEAAGAMADGARRALGTDYAVSITGIAGPTGGNAEKPIGTVFVACAGPTGVQVERHRWTGVALPTGEPGPPSREEHKHKSALAALELLHRMLADAAGPAPASSAG
jgi:PncC family amidohydrolase